MDAPTAIARLQELKQQGQTEGVRRSGAEHERWKASVMAVLSKSLPQESATPIKFSAVRYGLGFYSGAPGESERSRQHFAAQVDVACGLVDAAIFELQLEEDEVDASNYDPHLWQHVGRSVEQGSWAVVASAVATFVEDQVRTWSGTPRSESGGALVGQALFAKAFAEDGPLRLGGQSSEIAGWKNLALGFAAALSNVDRHRVQDRADLRRYSLGVLGLGSLLLTQVKYEHPEVAGK